MLLSARNSSWYAKTQATNAPCLGSCHSGSGLTGTEVWSGRNLGGIWRFPDNEPRACSVLSECDVARRVELVTATPSLSQPESASLRACCLMDAERIARRK
eukprot:3436942-Rhodomonas_salina.2